MPYLGSTLFAVTLFGAFALAVTAWWLLVRSLAPRFVERAKERWSRRPIITTLLGFVTGGFATIVGVGLCSVGNPATTIAGTAWLTALLALSLAGTAGLAARIGEGLASPSDEGREWIRTLKGGVVLELCFLLPVLGWFVVAPIAVYGGLGAAIQALVQALVALPRTRAHAESA